MLHLQTVFLPAICAAIFSEAPCLRLWVCWRSHLGTRACMLLDWWRPCCTPARPATPSWRRNSADSTQWTCSWWAEPTDARRVKHLTYRWQNCFFFNHHYYSRICFLNTPGTTSCTSKWSSASPPSSVPVLMRCGSSRAWWRRTNWSLLRMLRPRSPQPKRPVKPPSRPKTLHTV